MKSGTAPAGRTLPALVLDRAAPVAAQVHAHIRRLILRLHLAPGEALSEKEISLALGASRTPVREAFIKLAEEGLVDVFPQRGTVVAPIRIAEVEEAQFLREVVEDAVIRRVAEVHALDIGHALDANLGRQAAALDAGDHDAFMDLDEDFHRLLTEGAALPRTWRVIQGVKGQLDRVRYVSLPGRGHADLIYRQHRAIAEAVRARDAGRAAREMHDHLIEIWASIERLMRDRPDYFQA